MTTLIARTAFAGFKVSVRVNRHGAITMSRFGSYVKPEEAIALGLALIKAGAMAQERVAQMEKEFVAA